MKTVEEFIKELEKGQAKIDSLKQLESEKEVKEFIQKEGISCTAEELGNALGQYLQTHKELSDDELSDVTGGKIQWGSEVNYKTPEQVRYEFNVGERVEMLRASFFYDFTKRGTIIKAYPEKNPDNPFYPYRPVYDIQCDDGSVWHGKKQTCISY